ncbi:MAG: endolytic transglycosylase MltG [Patescibacteria group bacterium]
MMDKRKTNVTLIISITGLILVGLFFYFVYLIGTPITDINNAVEKEVTINKGDGSRVIADTLFQKELIKSKNAFFVYTFIEGVSQKLQAGTYKLSTDMSIKDIVLALSEGKLISNERKIKIGELSNKEIGIYLEEQGIMSQETFLEAASAKDSHEILPDVNYSFLADKNKTVDLEGYLFPDTYYIYINSQAKDIIKKMLDNFDKKLTPELREAIAGQNKTIFEIVTMASILEKELTKDEDRKIAADLFYRRIEIGMPMQSDATVNYATGKSERQPTYSDLETVSPYNTYLNKGLPPGPICNPSLSAIKAAIYPTPNEYYYYLNKKDGTTVWSKTAEEHAANKAKYLD